MERLQLFNLLVKAKSYTGLIVFAETLENEKDYEIADNVVEYVRLAQSEQFKKIAQKKYSLPYVDRDLRDSFMQQLRYYTKSDLKLEDAHNFPKIIEIMGAQKFKNEFTSLASQKLNFNYQMPIEQGKRRARKYYSDVTRRIVDEIPSFQNELKFITLIEQALRKYNLDCDLSVLDPNSYTYKYVFDDRSPAKAEIEAKFKTQFNPEQQRAIIKHIIDANKDRIESGEITPETQGQAERKFKKTEENRKEGIQNSEELDILKKTFLQILPDLNLQQFTSPIHPDFYRFFVNENLDKIKDILNKQVQKSNVPDWEDTSKRLFDNVIKMFNQAKANKSKYDKYLQDKANYEKEQEDKRKLYLKDTELKFKKEQEDNLNAIKERIQKDLADKDEKNKSDKKWHEFWKKSCVDYQIKPTAFLLNFE